MERHNENKAITVLILDINTKEPKNQYRPRLECFIRSLVLSFQLLSKCRILKSVCTMFRTIKYTRALSAKVLWYT